MNKLVKKEKGFTIIEVVLVLAIAGLIFLVVFLALPALQASQRDSQRKSDIGRVTAAVQTAKSNGNGVAPTLNGTFISSYLTKGGSSFVDPSGGAYVFNLVGTAGAGTSANLTSARTSAENANTGTVAAGNIYYVSGVTCEGTTQRNTVSIVIGLEAGGNYCQSV